MNIYDKYEQLIGEGYITDELFLRINECYEIPADQCVEIINLSDPSMPSSYYRTNTSVIGPKASPDDPRIFKGTMPEFFETTESGGFKNKG